VSLRIHTGTWIQNINSNYASSDERLEVPHLNVSLRIHTGTWIQNINSLLLDSKGLCPTLPMSLSAVRESIEKGDKCLAGLCVLLMMRGTTYTTNVSVLLVSVYY
jgi:hypothetical protein